jgi:hypothetical protein
MIYILPEKAKAPYGALQLQNSFEFSEPKPVN